ncbi:MAG: GGDEF domain-containing protein [Clostridia bacterium]|nr:GGDEF domain-containing protein [Clostridia bacterium]
MDYIIVTTICALSLLIGILSLAENELFSQKKKNRFIAIALIVLFEIIIDTIALEIDGKAINYIELYRGLKIIEFIVAPLIPTILGRLVAHKVYWKKIQKYFYIIIVLNTTAQLLTFSIPLMFNIDENAVYSRTIFTYFYVASLVICFIMLIIASKKTYIQNNAATEFSLISVNVLFFIGMVIRGFLPQSNTDWLCLTLGYFIFIVYYSNSYLKIDPITLLSNRRAFNSKISNVNYSTAIIVIDANNFKNINDAYGHQCGDLALSKIAEAIFETYSKVGYCYRTGGDEFTVILKKGMLTKLTTETENYDTYRMIYNLMTALNERVKEMSKKYFMLRYGVSQGFGIYWTPSKRPTVEEHMTIDEVIKVADERMYQDKLKFKKRNMAY